MTRCIETSRKDALGSSGIWGSDQPDSAPYILGDRWRGDVSISGDSLLVIEDSSLGGHGIASVAIDARKP
jgi:hypothetical protein